MKAKDLRNSILQLAVQGKLVPQDPNDEPASVLLERIRAERAKLIKEKKIKAPKGGESVIYRASDGSHYEKRGKGEPVCIDDEIPFEIPESWEWARVGSLTNLINGKAFKPSDWTVDGLPIVRIQNLNAPSSPFNRYNGEVDEAFHLHGGELLFAWSGTPGTSFGAHIWYGNEALLNQHIFKVEFPESSINKGYFRLALNQRVLELIGLAHGSAGLQHVTRGVFESTLIPIPPLDEQGRIEASVAALLPLVDDYGALEEARERLDAELPDRLRKSILQMAVQGKLVPQDPADEPASALLDRIRAEREKLIKAGRLKAPKGGESVIYRASDGGYYEKRGKGEPVCIDDEVPFDIPESWAWARLGTLANYINGYAFKPEHRTPKGTPIIRIQNLTDANAPCNLTNIKVDDCYCLRDGDVLVSWSATLRAFLWTHGNAYLNQHIFKAELFGNIDSEFYISVMNYLLPQLKERAHGSTMRHLTRGVFESILFPLPPIEEQRRITLVIGAVFQIITNQ